MKYNKIKKALILTFAYLTIMFTVNENDNNNNELYPYNNEPSIQIDSYCSYSKGNIYICNEDTIKRIIVNSNDIYIIDKRNECNPVICICNSYKIKSKKVREEIINILLNYEKNNPSNWNRSKSSLMNEWLFHNIAFEFGYQISHSQNVDFDNEDEIIFSLSLKK